MPPAPAACVFCGQPIEPGDEMSGRPPHAAHPRCADAALADDRHWDAVAAASGDAEPPRAEEPQPGAGRRAGCLGALMALLVAAGAVASGRGAAERRR